MSRKEPSRYQLSSRLQYNEGPVPSFLQRLRNQVAGIDEHDSQNDGDDDDEWETISGRPPIPRRPTTQRRPSPPHRPDDDPGSADGDDEDEKPQVVVLREGKHMTAREAENERRKIKGLDPLPDEPATEEESNAENGTLKGKTSEKNVTNSLSFSSSSSTNTKSSVRGTKKRKPIGDESIEDERSKKSQKKSKKGKGNASSLLSFAGDE